MALTITGRLHTKGQTETIKENFQKREFIVEMSDEIPTGMVFTNYAKFQLINNNCNILDYYKPGNLIRVSFALNGKLHEKDGYVNCYTNLNVWRIESAEPHVAAPAPAQAQTANPTTSQPGSGGFGSNGQPDDLPF